MTNPELSKLIAKCYDNDPGVRKGIIPELLKYKDHPAASFALLELLFDKDESVREEARKALGVERDPAVSYDEMIEGSVRDVVKEIKEKVPEDKREKIDTFIQPLFKEKKKGMAKQLLEFLDTEIGTVAEEMEEEVEEPTEAPDDVYGRFYNMVKLGMNERELKWEADKLKKEIEKAYKAALKKLKKKPFRLSELKPGMRSVYLEGLRVLGVSTGISGTGKSAKEYVKLIVDDGETQIPVYIFEGKGEGIRKEDIISLERAYTKEIKDQLSIVAGKRARITITRE